MRRLLLPFFLLASTLHAGERRLDGSGDVLPAAALARLGTIRLRSGDYLAGVALAPDGKTVAMGSNRGFVQLVALATGKQVGKFMTNSGSISSLVFAPDGKSLAIGDYGQLQIWDMATGQVKFRLPPQQRAYRLQSLTFSADGALFAAGPDGAGNANNQKNKALVWDLTTNRELGPFEVIQDYRVGAALSADGKRLATWGQHLSRAGGNDRSPGWTIQLWDVKEAKELRRMAFEGAQQISEAAFSPDGKTVAAVSGSPTVCVWDADTGVERMRLAGRRGLAFVRYSPDGKHLIAGDSVGAAIVWDAATGKRQGVCESPAGARSLAFTADGRILACGSTGQAALVWELPTGRMLTPNIGHTARVTSLGFTTDGKALVSAGQDGMLVYWDRSTGQELSRQRIRDDDAARYGASNRFDFTCVSADARYLITSSSIGNGARLWELPAVKAVCDFDSASTGMPERAGIGISPNGSLVAIPDRSGQLRLWDVESGLERAQVKLPPNRNILGSSLVFSNDGRMLAYSQYVYDNPALGQYTDIRLINSNGKELHNLKVPGNGANIQGLTFSPDGRTLAFGSMNAISFFDVGAGSKRRDISGVSGQVSALAWSPDGRVVACAILRNQVDVSGSVGEIQLYEIASGRIRARFTGHTGLVDRLAWSLDSQTLASAGMDTSIMLWDAIGTSLPALPQPVGAAELDRLWQELAELDGERGYKAMTFLQNVPEPAVQLLKERFKVMPVRQYTTEDLQRLLRDLDSDSFPLRQKATERLDEAGRLALPALRQRLKTNPPLEVRRRINALIARLTNDEMAPEELRQVRAVEVLEHLGSGAARELLQAFASGALPLLNEQAKDALARLR